MSDLLYEKTGRIAKIIINRPEKRNAINGAVIKGIAESLDRAEADDEVRAVVLCGAGEKAFTAGFDLKETMEHNITDIVERRADTSEEVEFFMRMWRFSKPIVCKVQGYCIGGGITLAMLCDMVIASEDASFGNPEIVMGFIPEFPIEIWKMPFNKVREFYFMGKYYTAKEMEAMNAVNKVVPYEELEAETMRTAERMAQIPAESMKMMKYSLNKCYELCGLRSTIDFAAEMFNLGRTHMQLTQVDEFRNDIANGGLKTALNKQYHQ